MKKATRIIAVGAAFFVLSSFSLAGGRQQKFTVEDLQKMVDELKPYLPEDPRFTYPIKCVVVDKKEVNANASYEFDPSGPKDQKPRAKMTVYTGLLDFMKDIRMVRAVVAHELSHLAKGHLGKSYKTDDLALIFTRQQEYEADATGAIALEKAGYSRKDMVDMLFKLGESSKDWPGSEKVLGDHADTARRAAAVGSNSLVLRSMVSFQDGEAYMDARMYLPAMRSFDKAIAQEPKFYQSKYNAASAALLNYYSNVAQNVVQSWYVPDFGPLLAMPEWGSRAGVMTEGDQANYLIALTHVKAAFDADPAREESLELQGLALILDPDGKPENLQEGIKDLKAAFAKAMTETDKLRIANNMALGYQRAGNVSEAVRTMVDAQRDSNKYNPYLAVNLGQQVPGDEFKGDALKVEQVLYTYLIRVPKGAMGYDKALDNYPKICTKFGLQIRDIKAAPTYLANVLSLTQGSNTFKMLDPIEDVVNALGKAENANRYNESYNGMKEYIWNSGAFSVITDSRNQGGVQTEELLRITSYTPGASIDIVAQDRTVNGAFHAKVGMSVDDFSKFLDPAAGISRSLVRDAAIEEWTYFPGVNFGVFIKDGKIAGITVCPVRLPDP
ncbi:MAG: M48 family metallopeptidase [Armatimonadetes bacterium]|nr:M48 family metallopeptidase [Armatimonadota bacterium]MBS1726120.1 M48 family metallopeptidase [Armatimonadota bacterium]